MRFYYTNTFLLGLYAFLTQTHLSIVRGIDVWDEMRDYFSEQRTLRIIDALLDASQREKYETKLPLAGKIFYAIRKKQYLTSEEWMLLCQQLEKTRILLLNASPARDELIDVRMKLCNLSALIERRFSANRTIRKIADKVEHFYQAEFIIHYSIEQIVGIINGYMKSNDNESLW